MSGAGDDREILSRMLALPPEERDQALRRLSDRQLRELRRRWPMWAHAGQLAPTGDAWSVWMMVAGRGFGKTRAGAEWVSEMARLHPWAHIALVGATIADARRVMVEGPSGVLAVARDGERPEWRATSGTIRFHGGASAQIYGAAAAETLRGPEHAFAWADELGKWRGAAAWDNLMMGLRQGDRPRALVTTTPRATALMRRLYDAAGTEKTRGASGDNLHLPPAFLADMEARYGGTRLGRQEIDGEMLEDVEAALWTRALLARQRVTQAPAMVRVVVGVDPPASAHGDACGIVAAGRSADGALFVLEDASVERATPDTWARAVRDCFVRANADLVVAEKNQGGDMVASVLRDAGRPGERAMPVRLVHASKGKARRAEPVAAQYERGRAWHVGRHRALEEELTGMTAGGGYDGPGRSPDRADACVWALTELMQARRGRAGVRALN